ncbi:MAG: XTP/dITP diphosphatase [Sedimentisphaerales bacterium]
MSDKYRQILIATTNPGKVAEIQNILGGEIRLLSLSDFESIDEIEEDGSTFEENARKKALGYAEATGCWTIADDSGLSIDALDGAPGVNSARFSGEKTKNEDRSLIDHRNIAKVLELLKSVSEEKRTARFVCCLCLASPERIILETRGTLEGVITEKEIGTNGFGYDPIMYVPTLKRTVAQLSREEKNAISHRGKAVRELAERMKDIL